MRCQIIVDTTISSTGHITSKSAELHAQDLYAIVSNIINCDNYLFSLEEDSREAMQNINPANVIVLRTPLICAYLLHIEPNIC